MNEWQNFNKIDWQPETDNANVKESWDRLATDFVNRILLFPSNFIRFRIRDLYWEALFNGELRVDSTQEEICDWMKNKADEDNELDED